MTTFTHAHVMKFYALYTSERREVAEWLSVSRERPDENDTLYAKRTLLAAKDAGKLDELATRIDAFNANRPR